MPDILTDLSYQLIQVFWPALSTLGPGILASPFQLQDQVFLSALSSFRSRYFGQPFLASGPGILASKSERGFNVFTRKLKLMNINIVIQFSRNLANQQMCNLVKLCMFRGGHAFILLFALLLFALYRAVARPLTRHRAVALPFLLKGDRN